MITRRLVEILAPNYPQNLTLNQVYSKIVIARLMLLKQDLKRISTNITAYTQNTGNLTMMSYSTDTLGNLYLKSKEVIGNVVLNGTTPLIMDVLFDESNDNEIVAAPESGLKFFGSRMNETTIYATITNGRLVLKLPKTKSYLATANKVSCNLVLEDPAKLFNYTENREFDKQEDNFPIPDYHINTLVNGITRQTSNQN